MNMLAPGALTRAAAVACAVVALGASAAPLAYVPNEGGASVSVIDTASDKVVKTFKVGTRPRGVAVSLDGTKLYISEQNNNSLLTVDTASGETIARTKLGDSPEGIYLSADGKWLAAAIEENNQALLVDTATGQVARRIAMRGKNPEHT